jgi:hypothetical protein
VVHFCLDGNSCAGLKGLCPSPGIKYYADGNSCAPKSVYHRLVSSVKRLSKFQIKSLCIFALVAVESEQV